MEIEIKGTIIGNDEKWLYDYIGIESVCPKDVKDKLDANTDGETVDVYINSGGGDIFAAAEIYENLRQYDGPVMIHVTGLAASAASVIMCARRCDISPTSLVMIHNVSTYAGGDKNIMSHQAEVLSYADESICAAYELKTGMSKKELLEMMDHETWMSAQRAVELGFCNSISGKETLYNGYCRIATDEERRMFNEEKQKLLNELEEMERSND